MTPLLVIDNAVIGQMLNSKPFRDEFPFMAHASRNLKGAAAVCCRLRNEAVAREAKLITNIKVSIAGMADSRKLKLKQMLNAHRVRLLYRQPGGAMRKLTF